ncbi:hypothetical protein GOBAR_AA39866 [Gossypium barbadense]|uniref:Uncharacterized protein n=1 Tax=Gossypium barbadense TaxID=3634 RepID=A0A2P5VPS8_GOSBA|nr:hypothetical protein GOBAR_AA39866 [Gossypium barbadense]
MSTSFKESGGKGSLSRRVVRPSCDVDNEFIMFLHGSDPMKVELNQLENEVRVKMRCVCHESMQLHAI